MNSRKTMASEAQLEQARKVLIKIMLAAKSKHNGVCMFDSGDSHPDNDDKWQNEYYDMGLNIYTNALSHYICEEVIIKIILRTDGLFKIKLIRERTNPKDLEVTIYNISNFFSADTPGILSIDKKQVVAVCDTESLYDVVMFALEKTEQADWVMCCQNNHRFD